MDIEKVLQYECKVCGRKIDVTRTGDVYEEPIFCCGVETAEAGVMPDMSSLMPAPKPKKKPAKKKAAKKAAKKAVKKKAAKKAVKKPAKKKAAKKKATKKKAAKRKKR